MYKNAVLYSWHEKNCIDPVLHGHSHEVHLACATCGRYVKHPEMKIKYVPNVSEEIFAAIASKN